MFQICLIGVGNIGFRHLQGLSKIQIPVQIEVVDKNEESLRNAENFFKKEVINKNIKKISFYNKDISVSNKIDLAIIATGSKPRAEIIKNLLQEKYVENLILEKFLFPDLHNYSEVEEILLHHGLYNNTWVNCPRRLYDSYHELKLKLASSSNLSMNIEGFNWGLTCNSVHYLDLLLFLSNEVSFEKISFFTDSKSIPSKRNGYVEYNGNIYAKTEKGNRVQLISKQGEAGCANIIINSDKDIIYINESENYFIINGQKQDFITPYQSVLSGKMAEDILVNKRTLLSNYKVSAELHRLLLSSFLSVYNQEISDSNNTFFSIT